MTPRRVCFVGPTLPPDMRPEAGWEYRPAIRHGDLFALDLRPGDQVLIIDGVYQHFAPIRHKEILAQIARGVRVAGAASMGALRAAELSGFGMLGLGRVYESARTGRLVADADVAVLHADDDEGSRRLTVALVSVRQAIAELADAGQLGPAEARELERIGALMHFCERSEQALLWAAQAGGCAQAMRRVLDHLVLNDVKMRDALSALDALVDAGPGAVGGPDAVGGRDAASADRVWQSSYGREWEFEHRPLRPGSAVSARFALACLQLFDPGFPRRHLAYVLRLASATVGRDGSAAEVLAAAGFASGTGGAWGLARPTAATAGWTAEERLLARAFRLRPGRLVYLDIPPEALAETTVAELERWCLRLMLPPGAPAAPTDRCRPLLWELWQATTAKDYRLCCLERGFRDAAEAARLASVFDLQLVERLARPQNPQEPEEAVA